ncbi:MAG: NAD(P)H-dependent oxidoreductase, partial [Oscillospiraceae bacterium]|nr:NAD(P)H-dependent oxidoreductase [Oscillospiraceae bacterium]
MSKKTIGIFVGSLRRDSFSKKVACTVAELLTPSFDVKRIDISALALYNEDLDNEITMPSAWRRLRGEVAALDAVLFVMPEYNRSLPAVLKNALDVASRPHAANAWDGKPGAMIGVSPGSGRVREY